MLFLQTDTSKVSHFLTSNDWSAIGGVAQAIIAVINLGLAAYIFIYQRRQSQAAERQTAELNKQNLENNAKLNRELISNNAALNEQNIRLKWFKELIVQPNIDGINSFYNNLNTIKGKITTPDLSVESKEQINDFVKAELSGLRKSFVDVMLLVDKAFATEVFKNLDELIDGITNAIFNDELKLNNSVVYDKYIGSKISYSRNSLLAQLYNYKGVSG